MTPERHLKRAAALAERAKKDAPPGVGRRRFRRIARQASRARSLLADGHRARAESNAEGALGKALTAERKGFAVEEMSAHLSSAVEALDTSHGEWSREEMIEITMPDGGWLKWDCPDGGFNPVMMFCNLPARQQRRIASAWAGHTMPILVQNSKQLPGLPSSVFDLWGDPGRVEAGMEMLAENGIRPLLFLASDHDARQRGMDRMMRDLANNWPQWGHLVAGICPRIEIGEELIPDYGAARNQAETFGRRVRSTVGDLPALWLHFNEDLVLLPRGGNGEVLHYDGLLYQFKRIGDDGSTLRSGPQYRHELSSSGAMGDYPAARPQDRVVFSAAETCRRMDLTFVAFEMTPRPEDTLANWRECKAGAMAGLRDLRLPELFG